MATCAGITGQALPDDCAQDSYNILPALLDPALARPIRPSLIHHSGTGVFSIRRGSDKLILDTLGSGGWPPPRGGPPEPGTPGQLYDLDDDPGETNNLWEARPEVVAEMAAMVAEQREAGRSRG